MCLLMWYILFFGAEERLEDTTGRILYIRVEYIHSETVQRLMSFARDCFLSVKLCTYRGHLIINANSRTRRITTSLLSDSVTYILNHKILSYNYYFFTFFIKFTTSRNERITVNREHSKQVRLHFFSYFKWLNDLAR